MPYVRKHEPIVNSPSLYWRETWPYFYHDTRKLHCLKRSSYVAVQIRTALKTP